MSPAFVTERPFFSKTLTWRNPALYAFDLFALLFVVSTWAGLDALSDMNHNLPVAQASSHAVAMIAIWGVYSVRIATWITILRGNRMPQTAEWVVCLCAFTAMILCMVFSGPLVRVYASTRGYRFCYATAVHKDRMLTFVRGVAACPAEPKSPGS